MSTVLPAISGEGDKAFRAPPEESFAQFPASWYLFGTASELQKGPLTKRLLGRELVGFWTESGSIAVLDARCSHLGADLGKGKVVGEALRCPFHEWEYGCDGQCTYIPHSHAIPEDARQRSYPVVMRHGLVFFFNGPTPLFSLPFFLGAEPDDFVASKPMPFHANCTWYMFTAHGFDLQHFESVHNRKLLSPLEVDQPAPFARRSSYTAQVLGGKYYDHFLRAFVGEQVSITITTFGGTFVVITGQFRRTTSHFMIIAVPNEDKTTTGHIVVFAPRGQNRLRHLSLPLELVVRRWLTRGYLVHEAQLLGNPRYNTRRLIQVDQEMVRFFQWAATLPCPDWGDGN